jgi:Sulfotransferase family
MTRPAPPAALPLLDVVEEALSLLGDYRSLAEDRLPAQEPLPSLLEQCEAATAAVRSASPEPVRTLHHVACSGGTLISKCLALMPNTTLLSEFDPLSRLELHRWIGRFAPTDLVLGMRASLRADDDAAAVEVTLAGVAALRDLLERRGQVLVIRDHPHSAYFAHASLPERPALRHTLSGRFDLRSVVTVRHPVDSLLSLRHNRWVHYTPDTVEEYCRRYMRFLDAHDGLPVVRYEDFVAAPEAILQRICAHLSLPYREGTPDLLSLVRMSGDSGRSGMQIAPRPRRDMTAEEKDAFAGCQLFVQLCCRLGYTAEI